MRTSNKILIILLCCIFSGICGLNEEYTGKFRESQNAELVQPRLLKLMRSYYEDADQRTSELNYMRFMYEKTSQYEMGYVIHELIERYRKLVEQMVRMDNTTIFGHEKIERTELIQKLYFEIYHLVNMVHEIPRKWRIRAETELLTDSTFRESQKELKRQEEAKKNEAKNKRKQLQKARQKYLKKHGAKTEAPVPGAKRVPYNPIWPLDYGWEVMKWW